MEEMQRRLGEAAVEGNVIALLKLLEEDKPVLDGCAPDCFTETPLHISAMLGHLEFTRKILCRKPEFAKELDFLGSSPLHLATANGHLEVARALLSVNPDMCFAQNRDGRNPLHIAVIKGRVDVLKELVQNKPEAVLHRTARGETVQLHLTSMCQTLPIGGIEAPGRDNQRQWIYKFQGGGWLNCPALSSS